MLSIMKVILFIGNNIKIFTICLAIMCLFLPSVFKLGETGECTWVDIVKMFSAMLLTGLLP